MARLTEEMVIARTKQLDLYGVKKLNCWGAELGDVSLLRQMPNVEVLAFSVNKIRTLGDFAACRRLRELYVRKNEIESLAEIRHLRHLPDLTSLWLDENPCTDHPEYRSTVLRNLPNLEKLDNVSVTTDEVREAMRRGVHIPDSDDEGYPHQQESFGQYRNARTCDSSPEREHEHEHEDEHEHEHEPYEHEHAPRARHESSASSEGAAAAAAAEPAPDATPTHMPPQQCPASPASGGGGARRSAAGDASPDCEERYEHQHPAMARSLYNERRPRSPDNVLRHSLSAHSVKEYAHSRNGECSAAQHHDPAPHHQRTDRSEWYGGGGSRCEWEQERAGAGTRRDREYPSAVMAERRGFTRRPVTRNSNLLSAVLCLVKELDYPSLEVAEMAVRCRMDELADSL